jgi:hypothetical protein
MPGNPRNGVTLVLVMGLVVLIGILVLSFLRISRDARETSQLAYSRIRAEHLLHTAIGRAMADVGQRMDGRLFYWMPEPPGVSDTCLVSTNAVPTNFCGNLISGTVLGEIPGLMIADAALAGTQCQWVPILADTVLVGRCAYLVANLSGFLDANRTGGAPITDRTDAAELDLSPLFDSPATADTFLTNRADHVRYDTRSELLRINPAATNRWDAFSVYSYDPDPDVYFTTTNGIGTRPFATNLLRRTSVATADWATLVSNLTGVVSDPDLVARCILDYQDDDRRPLLTNVVTEALPVINEYGVQSVSSNEARYVFELWYPFHPPTRPEETFTFATTDAVHGVGTVTVLSNLAFGTSSEFTVITSAVFTANLTNDVTAAFSLTWRASATSAVHLIYTGTAGSFADNYLEIGDPRLPPYSTNIVHTLGAINSNCRPWLADGGQGLPIYIPDRPMRNIGEIGYVFTGEPWRSLDLADTNVASLVNRFTVQTNAPRSRSGLVSAGATNLYVLDTLFSGVRIGVTNGPGSVSRPLSAAEVQSLHACMDTTIFDIQTRGWLLHYVGTSDYYTNGFLATEPFAGTDTREDALRGVAELVSSRHQLFLVVAAAQAVSPGGVRLAEQRAMALVWRDAYTGQYFIRWQIPVYD